ncbi:uncharacterized protein LY89DRAFT_708040 [Mollisia scopiformis]|uniref:L-lactate dehydrogenase (cytochrome) n=1 Tax=Mollisia scopiformis TaxID=149040 RepID=A0A194X756_MOLSC|nr:uncharacterized protein LY89DRAFT_708040 [Mollisia scopiformis]KUJ16003.1 hypothetical protein LY89DRAFT_708040 [Mollisia scopiformis]
MWHHIRSPFSSQSEIKHSTEQDCWIAVSSKVWDVTDFLSIHLGGPAVILKYAGGDATEAYEEIHAPGILEETLDQSKFIGNLAASIDIPQAATVPKATENVQNEEIPEPIRESVKVETTPYQKPPLFTLISAPDFTAVAEQALTPKAWAFYSSAATDLITHRLNKALVRRIMMRPRILRNVKSVSIKRKVLGHDSSAPFFISPAAMARLAHKDGELALARGASKEGIIQCISSNASYPLGSIVGAGHKGQSFFLQLYVNSEREKTAELLRKARDLGIKAIFVTVDAPVAGKREADERLAAENVASAVSGAVAGNDKKGGGMGRLMAQYVDKELVWEDISWIKQVSGLPVVLKGVQSAADAQLAVKYGCKGIMVSNHGGRTLDGAQPSILVLLEIHQICPEVLDKLEVFVDGGFERGSDILKALALGATAVGVGRPYLYSLMYSTDGVEHLTQILKDELETAMKLCGITSIDEAHPGLLNTRDIDHLVSNGDTHPHIKWKPRSRL